MRVSAYQQILGGAPRSANAEDRPSGGTLWSRLKEAGALEPHPHTTLSGVDQEMRALFRQLESAGVSFLRERAVRIPGLMDSHKTLTPEEAARIVAESPGVFSRLWVVTPEGSRVPLENFASLHGLDAVYGGGASVLQPTDRLALELLQRMAEQGCTFKVNSADYSGRAGVAAALGAVADQRRGILEINAQAGTLSFKSAEDLLTNDYFSGGPTPVESLKRPDLALALKQAEESGVRLASYGTSQGALAAYCWLNATTDGSCTLSRDNDLPQMRIRRDALHHKPYLLPGWIERMDRMQTAFAVSLKPVVKGLCLDTRDDSWCQTLLKGPIEKVEVRTALYADLIRAALKNLSPHDALDVARKLLDQVESASENTVHRAFQARAVCRALSKVRERYADKVEQIALATLYAYDPPTLNWPDGIDWDSLLEKSAGARGSLVRSLEALERALADSTDPSQVLKTLLLPGDTPDSGKIVKGEHVINVAGVPIPKKNPSL